MAHGFISREIAVQTTLDATDTIWQFFARSHR